MLKKEDIIKLLKTDDRAVARALLVLHSRQTLDEQAAESTHHHNGRGFRACDARVGSSMAKFFERHGFLTARQLAYWRAPNKRGVMRIACYWAQLLEAAEQKARQRAASMEQADREYIAKRQAMQMERDLGNDMERRMVLVEQLNGAIIENNTEMISAIKKELAEIDAYWTKKA